MVHKIVTGETTLIVGKREPPIPFQISRDEEREERGIYRSWEVARGVDLDILFLEHVVPYACISLFMNSHGL